MLLMDKEQILTKIQDCGIVAVVRAESTDKAIRITDACIEGGVAAIELTFTVPHADKVIEELAKRYTPDEIILGAGTVLDATTLLHRAPCLRRGLSRPVCSALQVPL